MCSLQLNFKIGLEWFHITVCYLIGDDINKIKGEVIELFKEHFGRNNLYSLAFETMMKNSATVSSTLIETGVDLEKIRFNMFRYVNTNYPNNIRKTRYLDGYPPIHVNVKGDKSFVGKTFTITYSIS
jgi:hypothetical protein